MRPGNFFAEPETLTALELMFTTGFWRIMLLVWSPVIFVGVVYFGYKYYKKYKASLQVEAENI